MKLIVLFAIIIGCISCKSTKWNSNQQWNNKPITWEVFHGNYVAGHYEATIYTGINYGQTINGKWAIWAYLNQNYSGCINCNDSAILIHEQYHFNIAEAIARKLRQLVIENKIDLSSHAFLQLFEQSQAELKAMQNLYDTETNHSLNKINQALWQSKIDEILMIMIQYANQLIN